jgi:hypothetical protein
MKFADPFYSNLYRILHQSLDRLIESCSTCEAHGDILLAPDDLEDDGDPTPSSAIVSAQKEGSAFKLLKAQLQTKGGDEDIPHLQAMISCASNLLIQHQARLKIQEDCSTEE